MISVLVFENSIIQFCFLTTRCPAKTNKDVWIILYRSFSFLKKPEFYFEKSKIKYFDCFTKKQTKRENSFTECSFTEEKELQKIYFSFTLKRINIHIYIFKSSTIIFSLPAASSCLIFLSSFWSPLHPISIYTNQTLHMW